MKAGAAWAIQAIYLTFTEAEIDMRQAWTLEPNDASGVPFVYQIFTQKRA